MTWTPKSLLDWCGPFFESKGIPSPRLDAERLLAHVLGCSRLDLYLNLDRPLHEEELARFRDLVRRRGEREPTAYLTGEAGFWSLDLSVRPGCLIPRPETETVVECVLDAIRSARADDAAAARPLLVFEFGTGSAAIPLAVCSEATELRWLGLERSAQAMGVAAENRRRHADILEARRNRLWLVKGETPEALTGKPSYDLIVSNPPYIPTATLSTLEPEVSRWEPRDALDGGPDGLRWHRALLVFAARCLAPGGSLVLEIGFDQEQALRELADAHAELSLQEVRRDLGKRPRAVWFRKLG